MELTLWEFLWHTSDLIAYAAGLLTVSLCLVVKGIGAIVESFTYREPVKDDLSEMDDLAEEMIALEIIKRARGTQ